MRDNYFLPLKVLRRVFRGKFVDALKQAFRDDLKLLTHPKTFAAWLRPLYRQDWVVYLKPPFGGPEYVLRYLDAIWVVTRTAWPSPANAWSPLPMAKSPFAGAIPLTATNKNCCPCPSMNS